MLRRALLPAVFTAAAGLLGLFLGARYDVVQPAGRSASGTAGVWGMVFAGLLAGFLVVGLVTFAALSFVLVRWADRRSGLIRPDKTGLYPVVRGRMGRAVYYHDPNRAPTSTTIYVSSSDVKYLTTPGREDEQFRLTSQAQFGQAMAGRSMESRGPNDGHALLELLAYRNGLSTPMPEVKISDLEPAHVERLLIECGELDD